MLKNDGKECFCVSLFLLLTATYIYCSHSICEFEIKIKSSRTQGVALSGFTYRTVNVSSLYQCLDVCMRDRRCESFNMKQLVGKKLHICEINFMSMTRVTQGQVIQHNSSDFYNFSCAMIAKVRSAFRENLQTIGKQNLGLHLHQTQSWAV